VDSSVRIALAVALALVPAIVSWWKGRKFAKRIDDPLLPEQLLKTNRSAVIVSACAMAGAAVASPGDLWWTLPLMYVASITAPYPLRRALYGETWSLATFLSFFVRLVVAIYGFWILLFFTPMIVAASGSRDWLAAAGLVLALGWWQMRSTDLSRALLRTRPVDHPAVVARFEQMVEAAKLPAPSPRFEQVDLHGGVVANAIALPSLRRSAVVMSETLLERLDADEITAIAAHELAHFEYYNRRRLWRIVATTSVLIILAVGAPLVIQRVGPPVDLVMYWLWLPPLLIVIGRMGRHRQQNETVADLRAVELCGDADAMIRALTKIHVIARYPRRWDANLEARATHPSLARRIQAIRQAAGTTTPAAHEDATFTTPAGDTSVTVGSRELVWREGTASAHTMAYTDLQELRVDAASSSAAKLLAVDHQGRRWNMPLSPADLSRVQAALDVVDVQLARPVRPSVSTTPVLRFLMGMAAISALCLSLVGVAFVACLAIFRSSRVMMAAGSVALLVGAAVLARDLTSGVGLAGDVTGPVALFGIGLATTLFLVKTGADDADSSRPVLALGVVAVLSIGAMLLSGVNTIALHQAARSWPGAAALPLAFATANYLRGGRTRWISAIAVLVGLFAAMAGTTAFLDHVGRDPFLKPAPGLTFRRIRVPEGAESPVPSETNSVRVSPDGRAVLVVEEDDDERRTIHVGRVGQPLASFKVDDGLFVDDRHVLLLESASSSAVLREIDLDSANSVIWQLPIPNVDVTDMSLSPAGEAWRLYGRARGNVMVRVDGTLGQPAINRKEWTLAPTAHSYPWVLASQGEQALVVETQYRSGPLDGLAPLASTWFFPTTRTTTIVRRVTSSATTDLAVSRLRPYCDVSSSIGEPPVCVAFDGTRSRIFTMDEQTGELAARAVLDGRAFLSGIDAGGWIAGTWNGTPVAFNLRAQSADAIQIPTVERLAVTGHYAAVVFHATDRLLQVRTFPLR
jgi:Zn-dependent protease with chaperone function